MGAGKSTFGPPLAERLGRPFVSVDAVVEEQTGVSVAQLFAERGEAGFRELEERVALELLERRRVSVIEIGGGGLGTEATRVALAANAFTVQLETTPDEAWERVAGSDRPLARHPEEFRALYAQRRELYERAADGSARDVDGAVLAGAGITVGGGSAERLGELVPGTGAIELVVDEVVEPLYGAQIRAAIGPRLTASRIVPAGERAKTLEEAERLWSALRLDRDGALVALGGGATLDLAGFVAATYLRGIAWVPVATTLLGQVDAAIGGKTAIDLAEGKNLVGAFHWPARTIVDPAFLATLPDEELANGLAEVVKTGLLSGEPLWELATEDQVRRCAAFKAAICLRDPNDRGGRAQLNLGHTFAHALESASGYELPHGRAVALGLVAALRLSGLENDARTVEEILRTRPVSIDREAAWAALARDKKVVGGRVRLVLLDARGTPRTGVEVELADVRAALDSLIA